MLGQLAAPDEWVTSDMPWATAWYADRGSLWLPDTVSDFTNLNDNFCPTGILLFTPHYLVPADRQSAGPYPGTRQVIGLPLTVGGRTEAGISPLIGPLPALLGFARIP